jgi:hypothetical protein
MATPPVVTFQCSQCGHCCNTWRVPIDAQRSAQLLEKSWVQERLLAEGVAMESLGDWGDFLPLKANQECVFWDEALHCLIHHHEGPQAKPLDCQRFPFSRLPAPPSSASPRYDVSAACSTVAHQHLFLWQAPVQPALLERQATASHEVPSPFYPTHLACKTTYARFPFPFHRYDPFARDAFQAFMTEALLPFFQDDALSPWQALHHTQAVVKRSPLKKSRPLDPSLGQAHRILATWLRSEYGNFPRLQWRFLGRYQDPRLFGSQLITAKDLAGIHFPTDLKHRYAKAFLFHLLRRESPLLYGASFWHSVVMAKIAYVLFDFYSKAFTLTCGGKNVDADAAELAIRCIERYYTAHQPRFLARVEANPHLAWGVWRT